MAPQEPSPSTAESRPQTIITASLNPVKTSAALQGFKLMFPDKLYAVQGVSVPSGVPHQPISDATTLLGAQNRAANARALEPNADFWVGIEGGVDEDEAGSMRNFAWVVVISRDGKMGKARTGAYYLPEETARLVRGGLELGKADDVVFGGSNTKQKNGSVGLLTGDVIDRTGYYVQAVILALIPFKNGGLTF
ncbi:Non-canonical purine NTP phosphatase [Madurella mycetomatis]|uniref:inosine/xanthosine triphosphatase n=1 Tax=Madurella mycetomatis TaxID=100816 RepID=A0A175VQE8_9PEZI|nr:Non-canonical purine NTP phosphatase [Madurella mycetomatis]